MKRGEFNARIAHVHKVRNQQRAIRNKVAAISGPPTYIRQMAHESMKKSQFNAMGDIEFKSAARQFDYEKAAAHTLTITSDDGFNLNKYEERNKGLVDDPKKKGLDDDWSLTRKESTPRDVELYNQAADKVKASKGFFSSKKGMEDEINEKYKEMVRIKHGNNFRPFVDSTMMVSHIEYQEVTKGQDSAVRQLAEIQDGIIQLNKTLTAINEQIGQNEAEFLRVESEKKNAVRDVNNAKRLNKINPQATTKADIEAYSRRSAVIEEEFNALNVLMNGDKTSPGLRKMAKEVRRGIDALEKQKRSVSAQLGIDKYGADARVSAAKNQGALIGGAGGALLGVTGLIALAMYMGDSTPSTTRGRGRNPIDIFG